MKNTTLKLFAFMACFYTSGINAMPIHSWEVGGSSTWRTAINFSNMCKHHDADVKLKFWNSDGSLLVNQQLHLFGAGAITTISTDSAGELVLTLLPHESRKVVMQHAFFPSDLSIGNARITTHYYEPGPACITAGYYTWSSGNSANSGVSLSYIINGGRRF